ncbi:hypothetical protein QFZ52_000264 [Arthrobacter woluwensis]|nr:hypothetical protein [Arthrobacter woluwensis]
MGMFGMDLEQGRILSRGFQAAAVKLEYLGRELTPLISSSPWNGPDGLRFKSEWTGHRQVLMNTSRALLAASQVLQRNVEEQRAASTLTGTANGPLPGESPWQWYGRLLASAEPRDSEAKSSRGIVGGLLHGAKDKAGGLLDGAKDKAEDIADGTRDRVGDAWDFARHDAHSPLNNIPDALGDFSTDAINLAKASQLDPLLNGEPPSISRVVAATAKLAGSTLNLGSVLVSGGVNHPHILDDGHPAASGPHGLSTTDSTSKEELQPKKDHWPTPVPTDLSNILRGVDAAYDDKGKEGTPDGAVRITEVDKHDGKGPAYIVSIPGTQPWNPLSGSTANDVTGNLTSIANGESTAGGSVELALEKAGVPQDAPVLLVGHSQGGIIAANLASDRDFTDKYNVTNVITYGSPVDTIRVPNSIDTLAIQGSGDAVPRTDLGNAKLAPGGVPLPGSSANGAHVVTLPSPDGKDAELPSAKTVLLPPALQQPYLAHSAYDNAKILFGNLGANHSHTGYADSVGEHESSGGLNDYKNLSSTQRFLANEGDSVKSTTSNIGRTQ